MMRNDDANLKFALIFLPSSYVFLADTGFVPPPTLRGHVR